VFVDVGANIGSFTLALAPLCKKVIAFEAQRMFAYMLAGSVALNGHKNVWVHNFAVGRKLGFLAIPQYDMNKTLAWGSVEFGEKQREPIGQERLPDNPDDVVRIVALDELISLIGPKLDVLKIDVEGMEIDVLEGAKWSIMYHRPVMLIEHVKSSKIELLECLIKIEYNAEDIGMDFLCLPKERQ
jgi:FkbM family methyltransferase